MIQFVFRQTIPSLGVIKINREAEDNFIASLRTAFQQRNIRILCPAFPTPHIRVVNFLTCIASTASSVSVSGSPANLPRSNSAPISKLFNFLLLYSLGSSSLAAANNCLQRELCDQIPQLSHSHPQELGWRPDIKYLMHRYARAALAMNVVVVNVEVESMCIIIKGMSISTKLSRISTADLPLGVVHLGMCKGRCKKLSMRKKTKSSRGAGMLPRIDKLPVQVNYHFTCPQERLVQNHGKLHSIYVSGCRVSLYRQLAEKMWWAPVLMSSLLTIYKCILLQILFINLNNSAYNISFASSVVCEWRISWTLTISSKIADLGSIHKVNNVPVLHNIVVYLPLSTIHICT